MTAWDPYDIDETTGLPRLPKGYFWRVERDDINYPRVALMRRRKYFFPQRCYSYYLHSAKMDIETYFRELDDPYEAEWDPEDIRDQIFIAARAVCLYAQEKESKKSKAREVESFYGDYPPKKLNN